MTLRVRGADRDLDARLGPQPGDRRGVELGAAGLDVGEVAPGEHVDAAEPGRRGEVTELGHGFGVPSLGVPTLGMPGLGVFRLCVRTDGPPGV